MPRISTVRNEGWDNSGLSCKISKWGDIAQKHTLQVIDESFDFQYVGTGLEYYNENKHMYILEGIEKSSSFDFFIRTNKAFVKLILKKVVLCYKTRIINCDEKKNINKSIWYNCSLMERI